MAVRWKVDQDQYERGATYKFFPEDITVVPGENGRYEDPDIEWMIADIRARGQETAVTVRNDGGKPVLVFGYQRYRAIRAVNERWPDEPKRKVLCIFKELNKEEAFRANIAENRMRNETTPVDDAHNMKRLKNVYGYSDDQVIAAFFPGELSGKQKDDARRWVRERMALIGLSPVAEQAVREGRLKLHGAIQLNKLPAAEQANVVATPGPVRIKAVKAAANTPAPKPRKPRAAELEASSAPSTEPLVGAWAGQLAGEAAETAPSPSYLAMEMIAEISLFFTRLTKPLLGLAEFCDAVADVAEGAQTVDGLFDVKVMQAIAAYRKARVA